MEKSWTDVNSDELLEPLLSVRDFERSIQVNRPTVSQADIQKHIEFTNESGKLLTPIRLVEAKNRADELRWRGSLIVEKR